MCCPLAQLFISLGIVALGTTWVKIEVKNEDWGFWTKKVHIGHVCSTSSLKFIETNWDGTPNKVLAARLLACPTVHFTWHCCTKYNLGEDWGFWTKKLSLGHVWNLLKQIGMGRLTKSLPPARLPANRCHLFHSASLHKVQFGCRRQLFFFSCTDIFTYLYHETLYMALSLVFY